MELNKKFKLEIEALYEDGIPCQLHNTVKYILNEGQIDLFGDYSYLKTTGSIDISVTNKQFNKLVEIENNWTEIEFIQADSLIKELIGPKMEYLKQNIIKLYRLLRWKYVFEGKDDNIKELNINWSITKINKFKNTKTKFSVKKLIGLVGFDEKDFERDLKELVKIDDDEPIQHAIIRDAYMVADSNPKNALLLSIIALEVGIKDFISKNIPLASWLVFNIPSPPVEKIMKEYLQILNPKLKFNEEHLRLIKSFVTERNNLSHKGNFHLSLEKLHHGLLLIREILYLLDYYRGHKWAIHQLEILPEKLYKLEDLNDEN